MSGFTIVGGVYRERCVQPLWDYIYGSAGRALAATSQLAPGTRLVSYFDEVTTPAAQILASENGGTLEAHETHRSICFDYLHPLATPRITPPPGSASNAAIVVTDDVVLRYGMLEGDAIVHAKRAIYDPQSSFGATVRGKWINGRSLGGRPESDRSPVNDR